MNKEQIDKIEFHLKDILKECSHPLTDIEQIRHNVFEIREHIKNKDYV